MSSFFLQLFDKLCFKHWVIGICRDNIKDIIRSKTFFQDIRWVTPDSIDHFNADPFLLKTKEGKLNIFYEDLAFDDQYGKIFMFTLDENLEISNRKILLDTKSHLSYPFIFQEKDKIYVFPEAAHSGKLSCYEYDPVNQSLEFILDIMNLPLLDSTIFNYNNKYWLWATINGEDSLRDLYLFFSDNLLGPYNPHPLNPVKKSLNGSRPAGNLFEVDGIIYRPSQNCEKEYGDSITINKISILNEQKFVEDLYMTISIDKKNLDIHKIHSIHTINILDEIIVVDGRKWTFSPYKQWKNYLMNRKQLKLL